MAPAARRALPNPAAKIQSRRALAQTVARLRRAGRCIVFANGCFDILHVGHARLLERARRLGDALVVGLNSDRSVQRLKGPTRPIVSERDRARLLAALACVDYVTIFDEPTPLALVTAIKPNILVKGADWSAKDIVGREVVERSGGRVVRVKLLEGYSTTKLLERICRHDP